MRVNREPHAQVNRHRAEARGGARGRSGFFWAWNLWWGVASGANREDHSKGRAVTVPTAKTTAFRCSGGVLVRVEGSGTMPESRVVHAFAEQALAQPATRLIVDLESCSYLDSTFLGGLVGLFKRHGGREGRFVIRLAESRRASLFGVSGLDQLLPFVSEAPAVEENTRVPLAFDKGASKEELTKYVIECHRRLAELGGPQAPAFQGVAEALEGQLGRGDRRR